MAKAEGSGGIDADTHISILAGLNLLGGGLVLVGGLFTAWAVWFGISAGTTWMGPWGWMMPGFMESLAAVFAVISMIIALPAVLAGVGLIRRSEWGRVLTFAVAAGVGLFALVSFTFLPIAYSVYAFWALTRDEVTAQFRDIPPRVVGGQTGS